MKSTTRKLAEDAFKDGIAAILDELVKEYFVERYLYEWFPDQYADDVKEFKEITLERLFAFLDGEDE